MNIKWNWLFLIGTLISPEIYSQTTAPIEGYRCSATGFASLTFHPDPDIACKLACQKPGFTFIEVSQSPPRGCYDENNRFRTFYNRSSSLICLTELGYREAELGAQGRYCRLPEDKAQEDHGCTGENGEGNPCNVSTGNKYQSETDFSTAGLSFTRSYNSQNLANLGLGAGWRHNFHRKLRIEGNTLTHISANGRGEPWAKVDGAWQGEPDSDIAIVETPSGFELTKASNVVETYNSFGQLLSITDTNAQVTTYNYNASYQLDTVTNQYGLSISFIYDEFNLSRVVDALGNEYRFEYYPNGNLESVIYSDLTADDIADNPRRIYHYENTQYPNHLTGITDENGDRYATWAYDVDGKAISTEHAQTTNTVGQEKFELDYQE